MALKIFLWLFYISLIGGFFLLLWHPFLLGLRKLKMNELLRKKIKKYTAPSHSASALSENEIYKKSIPTLEDSLKVIPLALKNKKQDGGDIIPREIIPLLRRAEALIARNEFDDAKKILINILALDRDNMDANSHLAFAYLNTGDFKKAESLFKLVIREKPKDPAVLTNYALSIFEQKDPNRISVSIEALKKATEIDSKNANRYSNLGQSYFFARDIESAISSFEQAIRLDPKNLEYHFFLADSFLSLEKYPEAKSVFEKILKLSPLNVEAEQELLEIRRNGL